MNLHNISLGIYIRLAAVPEENVYLVKQIVNAYI